RRGKMSLEGRVKRGGPEAGQTLGVSTRPPSRPWPWCAVWPYPCWSWPRRGRRRTSAPSLARPIRASPSLTASRSPPEEAEQAYRKAVALHEKLILETRNAAYEPRLRASYDRLAALVEANGRTEEAAKARRQAREFFEKRVPRP